MQMLKMGARIATLAALAGAALSSGATHMERSAKERDNPASELGNRAERRNAARLNRKERRRAAQKLNYIEG